MKKKYHGSCHCKKLKYEVQLDLAQGTGRCNCSYCGKVRNWSTRALPADFKLNANPADVGHYRFRTDYVNNHLFCKNCGVRIGTQGDLKEHGGEYVSIMLSTLDDVTVDELMAGPIRYMDGLHDNWFNPPAETRHL